MAAKFEPNLRNGDGYTLLSLRGVLDEDNSLARLTSKIRGQVMVLDLAEIDRINSCGVRDWVNWLQEITALGIRVVMIRCSPAIINQVNMVTNFNAGAVIHSFYAPYFDGDTDTEQNVLINTVDLVGQYPPRAPEVRSDQGSLMEFDDFEESYFAFVAALSASDVALDPQTTALVAQMTRGETAVSAGASSSPGASPQSSVIPFSGEIESVSQPAPPMPPPLSVQPSRNATGQSTGNMVSVDDPTPIAAPRVSAARQINAASSNAVSQSPGFPARPFYDAPEPSQSPFETGQSGERPGFISSPQDARRAMGGHPHTHTMPPQAEDKTTVLIIGVMAVALLGILGVLVWLVIS